MQLFRAGILNVGPVQAVQAGFAECFQCACSSIRQCEAAAEIRDRAETPEVSALGGDSVASRAGR
jgi:hypothetical protein